MQLTSGDEHTHISHRTLLHSRHDRHAPTFRSIQAQNSGPIYVVEALYVHARLGLALSRLPTIILNLESLAARRYVFVGITLASLDYYSCKLYTHTHTHTYTHILASSKGRSLQLD